MANSILIDHNKAPVENIMDFNYKSMIYGNSYKKSASTISFDNHSSVSKRAPADEDVQKMLDERYERVRISKCPEY